MATHFIVKCGFRYLTGDDTAFSPYTSRKRARRFATRDGAQAAADWHNNVMHPNGVPETNAMFARVDQLAPHEDAGRANK